MPSDTVGAEPGESVDDGSSDAPRRLPGTPAEAENRSMARFRGLADDMAPDHGVIWIFENPLRIRRMLDLGEYRVGLLQPGRTRAVPRPGREEQEAGELLLFTGV